jgi:hypothetical protein
MAFNYDEIERMKQENKEMRLELQRLKNVATSEFGGSHGGGLGGVSPKSFDGRTFHHKDSMAKRKDSLLSPSSNTNLSEDMGNKN